VATRELYVYASRAQLVRPHLRARAQTTVDHGNVTLTSSEPRRVIAADAKTGD
jgi:hypothetical protein